MAQDPRVRLNIVRNADPAKVSGPALVETGIRRNLDRASKMDDFVAALDWGMGTERGIAVCKLCYVDVTRSTDIRQLFGLYCRRIGEVRAKHPSVTIVHVTVPLTAKEYLVKALAKRAWAGQPHGSQTSRETNTTALRLAHYGSTDVVFDLAAAESTRPDGSRAFFTDENEAIYTLAREFTSDGGHLNELGRRVVAHAFLMALARAGEKEITEA